MNFWWGVLAGITAAFIFTIIIYLARYLIIVPVSRYLIEKVLICFPQARNLSGIWDTKFQKDGSCYEETAKVSQLFGKVWGTITYDKNGEQRKYRIVGSIKERILVATFEIESPKEPLDRGSFTLALSMNGMKLKGYYSWTDDESQEPKGDNYVWTRLRKQ